MPSVTENRAFWNDQYGWPQQGDEWSVDFGGTEALWWFVVYPRIHSFVPTGTILEIAPGFGRWTQYLKDLCERLILVDLSPRCIEYCRARFATESHISYHVNNGMSLAAVPDSSLDFAFGFDSLVHAERDVIEFYLKELSRKLKPQGAGFFHHSNMGSYRRRTNLCNLVPGRLRGLVSRFLSINILGGRATSMTGALFQALCRQAGLSCIRQELVSWSYGRCRIDAFSTFCHKGSFWDRPTTVLKNGGFARGATAIAQLAALYADASLHAGTAPQNVPRVPTVSP